MYYLLFGTTSTKTTKIPRLNQIAGFSITKHKTNMKKNDKQENITIQIYNIFHYLYRIECKRYNNLIKLPLLSALHHFFEGFLYLWK